MFQNETTYCACLGKSLYNEEIISKSKLECINCGSGNSYEIGFTDSTFIVYWDEYAILYGNENMYAYEDSIYIDNILDTIVCFKLNVADRFIEEHEYYRYTLDGQKEREKKYRLKYDSIMDVIRNYNTQ